MHRAAIRRQQWSNLVGRVSSLNQLPKLYESPNRALAWLSRGTSEATKSTKVWQHKMDENYQLVIQLTDASPVTTSRSTHSQPKTTKNEQLFSNCCGRVVTSWMFLQLKWHSESVQFVMWPFMLLGTTQRSRKRNQLCWYQNGLTTVHGRRLLIWEN